MNPVEELDLKIRRRGWFAGVFSGVCILLAYKIFLLYFTDAQAGLAIALSPILALGCGTSVSATIRGVSRWLEPPKAIENNQLKMAVWSKVMWTELILGLIGLTTVLSFIIGETLQFFGLWT